MGIKNLVLLIILAIALAGTAVFFAARFSSGPPAAPPDEAAPLQAPMTPPESTSTPEPQPDGVSPDYSKSVPVSQPAPTAEVGPRPLQEGEGPTSPPPAEPSSPKPPTSAQTPTLSEAQPPPPREPQEFIIRIYSNTRVDPADLTIRVGDTVTFTNEDRNLHWPGADPHPTHSSLPAFDALGGISKGQTYSYTFRGAGEYGYHEHLLDDPPTWGVITVLP